MTTCKPTITYIKLTKPKLPKLNQTHEIATYLPSVKWALLTRGQLCNFWQKSGATRPNMEYLSEERCDEAKNYIITQNSIMFPVSS